jgi:hypothetical protein
MSKTEAVTIAMSTAEVIEHLLQAQQEEDRAGRRRSELGDTCGAPSNSTSSNNWITPSKFEAMSCELDDNKEEEDRKSTKHGDVRRWQDGSPNEECS